MTYDKGPHGHDIIYVVRGWEDGRIDSVWRDRTKADERVADLDAYFDVDEWPVSEEHD